MESISRYTILSVWDCVRRKSKLKWSAGSPPEVRNQSPGQTRLSVYTTKKLPCQTRLAGRILPFCWGRKGESDPPRGAGDLRLHWGKKASQTRLSGQTRELGLSVNAVSKWTSLAMKPSISWSKKGFFPPELIITEYLEKTNNVSIGFLRTLNNYLSFSQS